MLRAICTSHSQSHGPPHIRLWSAFGSCESAVGVFFPKKQSQKSQISNQTHYAMRCVFLVQLTFATPVLVFFLTFCGNNRNSALQKKRVAIVSDVRNCVEVFRHVWFQPTKSELLDLRSNRRSRQLFRRSECTQNSNGDQCPLGRTPLTSFTYENYFHAPTPCVRIELCPHTFILPPILNHGFSDGRLRKEVIPQLAPPSLSCPT